MKNNKKILATLGMMICSSVLCLSTFAQPQALRRNTQANNANAKGNTLTATEPAASAQKSATKQSNVTTQNNAAAQSSTKRTAAASKSKAAQKAQQNTKSNVNGLTQRALISYPTQQSMGEDVVWRRDIYREVDLTEGMNSGLYYPVEPVGTQMNLFTYMFKLMLSGQITAYEYRLDGNESFTADAKVKPLTFMDNYHIYYERKDGKLKLDNSDIPSKEVKSYYIKECSYYDQATATFHTKVIALCPIMSREDDFGEGTAKYPLFWVKYDDIAPFLAKQVIMTSNLNNAATMSVDDYFTKNMYRGKIYKTNNMLGQTLAQYCPTDSAMQKEQKRIENELKAFEKNIWGDQARKDSLDSIAKIQVDTKATKKAKKAKTNRRSSSSTSDATVSSNTSSSSTKKAKKSTSSASSSSSSAARVSVRRQRH